MGLFNRIFGKKKNKDQSRMIESSEFDKKEDDPVQMCWKFLDEYNEKVDAIWDGEGVLGDESLAKLEQSFIQCIDKLNPSDESIAVLEAIISPQNMKMWSDIHTAANKKYNEFSPGEKVNSEEIEEMKTKKDVEELINLMNRGDGNTRIRAINALGEIKDQRAVEPLLNALNDTNDGVRMCSIEALGEIKDQRAVEPLIKKLNDSDFNVRCRVASALGEIKDPRAVEPLIKKLNDSDWLVCEKAASALGEIKDPRAVGPLVQTYNNGFVGAHVRAWEALNKINDPTAKKALEEIEVKKTQKR